MKGDKISYRKGYKYSLWFTYRVQINIVGYTVNHRLFELTPDGWLTIFEDYPWDGCSGMAWDNDTNMRAGLIHDAIYEMMRLGLLPHIPCFGLANNELEIVMLEDGSYKWRAGYYHYAVDKFGNAYSAVKDEPILTAP